MSDKRWNVSNHLQWEMSTAIAKEHTENGARTIRFSLISENQATREAIQADIRPHSLKEKGLIITRTVKILPFNKNTVVIHLCVTSTR